VTFAPVCYSRPPRPSGHHGIRGRPCGSGGPCEPCQCDATRLRTCPPCPLHVPSDNPPPSPSLVGSRACLGSRPPSCADVISVLLHPLVQPCVLRSVSEAIVHRVQEARKSAPSVLYLPRASMWWEAADAAVRTTLVDTLDSLPAHLPVLLLAITEGALSSVRSMG
jgi:hypothetical protein